MVVAIVILVVLVALGLAAVLGWTSDSRDPEYGLGGFLSYADRRHGAGKS